MKAPPPDFPEIPEYAYNEPPPTPIAPGVEHTGNKLIPRDTEYGNAERLLEKWGKELKYSIHGREWVAWDGKRWTYGPYRAGWMYQDIAQEIASEAQIELDQAYITEKSADENNPTEKEIAKAKLTKAKGYMQWAKRSQSARMEKSTLEILSRRPKMLVKHTEHFDRNDFLFNCKNGTINLKTGQLQPHRRSDNITKITHIEYDQDAPAPTWDWWLDDMFHGDQEIIRYLQAFVGYCLSGSTKERKMLLLHGGGGNGKSTFFNTICKVFGEEYSCTMSENVLMQTRNESHLTHTAALDGPHLAVNPEITAGKTLDEGKLKQVTGGSDKIRVNKMHKDTYEFLPRCKLIIATNNLPNIKDMTDSVWHRMSVLPFTKYIPPEQWDTELDYKLEKELPGILAWAVEGFAIYQEHGLKEPQTAIEYKEDYRSEMDSLQAFMNTCVVYEQSAEAFVSNINLYSRYKKWCEDEHEKYPKSIKTFNKELRYKKIPGTKISMKSKRRANDRGWAHVVLDGDSDGVPAVGDGYDNQSYGINEDIPF
jgi:putative DNA primase/helicase